VDRLNQMLLGAVALGFFVVALFFLRFWHEGRDRFFLLFSLSFCVEGANRVALALSPRPNEGTPAIYLVRLAALLLILVAILDKNGIFSRRG
jgi:uncharacterized membrane protein HdeD (DUF308 family)